MAVKNVDILSRRSLVLGAPVLATMLFGLDVMNPAILNASGSNQDFTNPDLMARIIQDTAITAGAETASVAVYSRLDLQPAGSTVEYANKGLKSTIAKALSIVVQTLYSKLLRAAGKQVGPNDFTVMVQDEFTAGLDKGREVYAKAMGIALPLSEVDFAKIGNDLDALYLKETGEHYPFRKSDYAKIHGTNTGRMPQIVAALNYAIQSLSDEEKAAYNKPEVPAKGARNMAWLLNPRNYGTLPAGIISDAGVFQMDTTNVDIETGKVRMVELFSYVADKKGVMRAFMVKMESSNIEATDTFSVKVQNAVLKMMAILMSNGIYKIT